MTLADYLESKAEYIFDNSPQNNFCEVDTKYLQHNKEIIIDNLKKGLRKLAQIHDNAFYMEGLEERQKKKEFEGQVYVHWVDKYGVKVYKFYIRFPHWSFAKIMLEKANKKFEDLFFVSQIGRSATKKEPEWLRKEDKRKGVFGFHVEGGRFFDTKHLYYLPSNVLFLNPVIAEFNKSNMFTFFKNMSSVDVLNDYNNVLINYKYDETSFGDFILMRTFSQNLDYSGKYLNNLLILKRPKETGVCAIGLTDDEYINILQVIKFIKETKKVSSKEIFLEDLLSKYAYLKIIKDINT